MPVQGARQTSRSTAAPVVAKVTKRFRAPPPARVKVKKMPQRGGFNPAVRHMTRPEGLDMILPKPGEHAVLLIKGHVMGLIRLLTFRVPLHPSFGPSILRQIVVATQREGAVATGGIEAVVLLRLDQVQALHQIVSRRFNHLAKEQSDELAAVLQKGLDRAEEKGTHGSPSDDEPEPRLLETG